MALIRREAAERGAEFMLRPAPEPSADMKALRAERRKLAGKKMTWPGCSLRRS